MNEANPNIIKIDTLHCYICGEQFQKTGQYKKTMHHAIPSFHKPKRNILIPICSKCHSEINKFTVQALPKLVALGNFIKSMKQFLNKYEKIMRRYNNTNE